MKKQKRLMLLGGSAQQVVAIRTAKEMGCYTVLCDYLLKVIMKEKGAAIDAVVNQLKEKLGDDANIRIEYVDDIPVLASGKRKPVINNWTLQ